MTGKWIKLPHLFEPQRENFHISSSSSEDEQKECVVAAKKTKRKWITLRGCIKRPKTEADNITEICTPPTKTTVQSTNADLKTNQREVTRHKLNETNDYDRRNSIISCDFFNTKKVDLSKSNGSKVLPINSPEIFSNNTQSPLHEEKSTKINEDYSKTSFMGHEKSCSDLFKDFQPFSSPKLGASSDFELSPVLGSFNPTNSPVINNFSLSPVINNFQSRCTKAKRNLDVQAATIDFEASILKLITRTDFTQEENLSPVIKPYKNHVRGAPVMRGVILQDEIQVDYTQKTRIEIENELSPVKRAFACEIEEKSPVKSQYVIESPTHPDSTGYIDEVFTLRYENSLPEATELHTGPRKHRRLKKNGLAAQALKLAKQKVLDLDIWKHELFLASTSDYPITVSDASKVLRLKIEGFKVEFTKRIASCSCGSFSSKYFVLLCDNYEALGEGCEFQLFPPYNQQEIVNPGNREKAFFLLNAWRIKINA